MSMHSSIALIIAALGVGLAQNVIGDFTRSSSEPIINEMERPFIVRSVHGIVTCPPERGDPLPPRFVRDPRHWQG